MKKFLLITLFAFPFLALCQLDSLRAHFAAGTESYQSADYQGFLAHMLKANEIRAYYPPVIYNIAAGYTLTGQKEKALDYLKLFTSFNASVNLEEDTDFANLAGTSELTELKNLQSKLAVSKVSSVPLDSISGTTHIESIAFDYKSSTYFLGDVRLRKVQQYYRGILTDLIIPNHPDFYGVMGLDVDTKNQLLWICTTALPQMMGYVDSLAGRSSLFSFDMKTKKLKHHATLRQGSTFGDLIVGKEGEVLISDGTSNSVYRFHSSTGFVKMVDLSEKVSNLQGMTYSADQKSIYVSDYISGIYRLDRSNNTLTKLAIPSGAPFKGIDGLYRTGFDLIGLENGSNPLRVVRYNLAQDGITVLGYQVLDQGVEFLNEPTQGVIVGKDLIYISNSPWGLYSKENEFPETPYTLILRKLSTQ